MHTERDLSIKLDDAQLELLKKLGERIRRVRLQKEWSMGALAERSQVTEGIIRKVERGTPGVALGRYLQVFAALGYAADISRLLSASLRHPVRIEKAPSSRAKAKALKASVKAVKVVARKKVGAPETEKVAYPKKDAKKAVLKRKKAIPEKTEVAAPKPAKPQTAKVQRRWTARYVPPKKRGRKKKDAPEEGV